MSSPNPSDPRLLLPDWLRDGDAPLPAPAESEPLKQSVATAELVEVAELVPVNQATPVVAPVLPYSERLSLDTRLDPNALVAPEDLPAWLGGLERAPSPVAGAPVSVTPRVSVVAIEEPEPYEGVDAPEEGVIDIEVNGWYMIVGALGLLILLGAALRLYLS